MPSLGSRDFGVDLAERGAESGGGVKPLESADERGEEAIGCGEVLGVFRGAAFNDGICLKGNDIQHVAFLLCVNNRTVIYSYELPYSYSKQTGSVFPK